VPYLSASAVVIHYEEALYQVYAPSVVLMKLSHCWTTKICHISISDVFDLITLK